MCFIQLETGSKACFGSFQSKLWTPISANLKPVEPHPIDFGYILPQDDGRGWIKRGQKGVNKGAQKGQSALWFLPLFML
jgi:hypothetical protein